MKFTDQKRQEARTPDKAPEKRLWQAVLYYAVADALKGKPEAIDWFFDPRFKEDRRVIGEMSGLDVDWFTGKVVERLAA